MHPHKRFNISGLGWIELENKKQEHFTIVAKNATVIFVYKNYILNRHKITLKTEIAYLF